jgi:predicted MFS family arabinose efflux permease
MAGVTFGCFLVVLALLPREKKFVRASNLAASLQQMLGHLRNPKLLAIYAVGLGVLFNFMAVFTYVNFHLAAPPFNASAAFLGAIFVVYLGGSLLTPWIGFAVARLGRRNFVLGAMGLWIAGLLVMLAPSIVLIVLGLLICAVCGFLIQAASTSYVAVSARSGTSAAVGLYVMLYYIGGSLGAYLPGLTWEAAGWPAVVAMVGIMICIIAVIVARRWE